MNGLIHSSLYFGMLVSVGAYMLGVWLKKKTSWAILNPLLVAIIVVIAFLSVFHIEYKEYNRGAVSELFSDTGDGLSGDSAV